MTTYNVDTHSMTWRTGRAPGIQECSASIWGAGQATGGQRRASARVEIGKVGDEWVCAVSLAADVQNRMTAAGLKTLRSVRLGSREDALACAPQMLRQLADDLEAAWKSDGERMPGSGPRLAVQVTAVTTQ